MPNDIEVTDTFSLESTLTGDSVNSISTETMIQPPLPKVVLLVQKEQQMKRRGMIRKSTMVVTSIYEAYAEELTKSEKHLPTHFLDQLIKKKQLEFDISQTYPNKQYLIA